MLSKFVLALPTAVLIGSAVVLAVAPSPKTMPPAANAAGGPLVHAVTAPLQAPAKSQLFPEGLSVTMEPADLWAIVNLKIKHQIPPPQYDHAVKGAVQITDVETTERLLEVCRGAFIPSGAILVGCAQVTPELCRIYLGPIPSWTGITRNINLRHELGHCIGWPADHPDAAPLAVAGVDAKPVPMPKAWQGDEAGRQLDRPVVVADGRDYPPRYEDEYLDEPPPRRLRRPYGPPPYPIYPPPPPPGWLYGPGGRLIPCALGLFGICI